MRGFRAIEPLGFWEVLFRPEPLSFNWAALGAVLQPSSPYLQSPVKMHHCIGSVISLITSVNLLYRRDTTDKTECGFHWSKKKDKLFLKNVPGFITHK